MPSADMAGAGVRATAWRWSKRAMVGGILVLFVFPLLFFLVFRFVPVPFTSFMVGGAIDGLFAEPRHGIRHDWVPLEEISPWLQRAVIASEDQKFLEHAGLDLEAIGKAMEHNRKGRRIRGASTISQQTVKNIFLWQGRSYVRKGLEAWLTLMMEATWSKERILEVYLNSVEFGRGIYGAEAAAQAYFGRSAAKLRRHDAALLAAVLPAPKRRNPAKPSAYVRQRANWIEAQMVRLGPVEKTFTAD